MISLPTVSLFSSHTINVYPVSGQIISGMARHGERMLTTGWWAVAESNCGHEAFQASALPTELTAHGLTLHIYIFSVKLSPLIMRYLLRE